MPSVNNFIVVIIELMTRLMGVAMGFLAFLVIGGASGVFAWVFYPRPSTAKPKVQNLLMPILIGSLGALGGSYVGQLTGFFQSGQMWEWFSAIIASCVAGCFYAALAK